MPQLFHFTVIFVNFSQAVYSAEETDRMMLITIEADGFSIWPYSVEITPTEFLPVGGPGKPTQCLTSIHNSVSQMCYRQC